MSRQNTLSSPEIGVNAAVTRIVRIARATLKIFAFGLMAVSYFVFVAPLVVARAISPGAAGQALYVVNQRYCRVLTWLLGLRVQIDGLWDLDMHDRNYLIVSNHLSYLDIVALNSVLPVSFVTSVEIRDTPFLGHLARAGGCLFVERRDKDKISEEIDEIANTLASGVNVVLFPEGTSTNGSFVKRFRRPLFLAAQLAQRDVACLAINYLSIDQDSVDVSNRDQVCWYGSMGFPGHFFRLLQANEITVELSFAGTVGAGRSTTVAEISERSNDLVKKKYRAIQPA